MTSSGSDRGEASRGDASSPHGGEPPTRLVFSLHFHQPYGNLDEVFADAMARCYLPTLGLLREHRHVRCAIHVSGPLLDWARAHQPEFIESLRTLVERGQVEILGGGYQEPMLAILPDRDAIGQLTRMADRCEAWLGQRPTGMWLTERVWEPDLARVIALSGYRYTLLDDTHLRAAGIEGDLGAYYVTDKAGKRVAVFPIDYGLRTRIPFAPVDELIDYLHTQRGRTAVYGDDVEKFGLWPTTERRVWTDGWLEQFFRALGEHRDWLRCVTPSEVMADTRAAGAVYIPTISYREMSSWTLPPSAALRFDEMGQRLGYAGYEDEAATFLRGGIWQSFLAKYPESNLIYRKMLRVSERVNAAATGGHPRADDALDALYQGQCNCAYWHGLFGGLYLQHLRAALMKALLEAEALVDARSGVRLERSDHDGDLEDELIVETPAYDLYLSPVRGGSALELSLLGARVHLTGVLGRHREAYHVDVPRAQVVSDDELGNVSAHDLVRATEEGLADKLALDSYPRGAFVDHLLPASAGPEVMDDYHPLARFADGPYDVIDATAEGDAGHATLHRTDGGFELHKRFTFAPSTIEVRYDLELEDSSRPGAAARFATHVDFTLLTPEEVGGRRLVVDGEASAPGVAATHPSVSRVQIVGESMGVDVELRIEPPCELWRVPIETVSQSERGFERAYQGTALVMSWPVEEALSAKVTVDVRTP